MLPTEIWELVITHLDQNSLAQCSYVSSMFSHISSQLLYNFPMLPTASRFRSFAKELTPRNAKLVETIDLTNTARRWDTIRKNEITDLLTKCLSIKHLDLDMCYNLRDSDIEIIMKTIGKDLRFLSLCSCTYLSGASIQSISMYCRKLTVLNISGICTFDPPLIEIARYNPLLETVNLAFCAHITEVAIKALMKNCPKLKYLNMEGCHNVVELASDSEAGLQPEWETEEEQSDGWETDEVEDSYGWDEYYDIYEGEFRGNYDPYYYDSDDHEHSDTEDFDDEDNDDEEEEDNE